MGTILANPAKMDLILDQLLKEAGAPFTGSEFRSKVSGQVFMEHTSENSHVRLQLRLFMSALSGDRAGEFWT